MLHSSMMLILLILILAASCADSCQDVQDYAFKGDQEKTCEKISLLPWKRRVSEAIDLPQSYILNTFMTQVFDSHDI